jgi:hypothetical protein
MEEASGMIESLRARADDFRVRAETCKVDRYASLMRKGAAHLDEEAAVLENRLRAPRRN